MKQKSNGFIAISAVLIVTAVVISIGITVSLLSIGEGQTSLSLTKGEAVLNLIESCAENTLLIITTDTNYTGGIINTPEGDCSVAVSKVGSDFTVTSTNTGTTYKRTIQIMFTRSTSLDISSWKEI